ncbi:hypothetical protein D3C86_1765230 [compost metagenome]
MLDRIPGADRGDQRFFQGTGYRGMYQDQCTATVADDAAVQPSQWGRNQGGAQHVFHADDFAQHGVGVVSGMV